MSTVLSRLCLLIGACVALPAWAAAQAAPAPERIVSINLCADELLIALADPSQIAALSVTADNPQLSYFAKEAAAYRHDAGSAETVIDLKPDLVLAGRFTKRATRDMLTALGYRVVLLDPARSIADSIAQIREIAALVGHADRGEALVADILAARDRAEAAAAARDSTPTAAVYQRRGYVTGGESLTAELLAVVGLADAGGTLAGGQGGFVPLEQLVAEPPQILVVSSVSATAEDQGSALLVHPALAALFPVEKRIVLPEKLTVCGGPSLPAALDWLGAEADRVAAAP